MELNLKAIYLRASGVEQVYRLQRVCFKILFVGDAGLEAYGIGVYKI